jgi:hypothetical protein
MTQHVHILGSLYSLSPALPSSSIDKERYNITRGEVCVLRSKMEHHTGGGC